MHRSFQYNRRPRPTQGGVFLQLYLAVTPPERQSAARHTKSLLHVAYRVGPDSTLLRRDLPPEVRGGLMSISDHGAPPIAAPERLCAAVVRECGRRNFSGVVLEVEGRVTEDRRVFARQLARTLSGKYRLFLPEDCPAEGAVTLINTAVSGGSFLQRLREARAHYGAIALDTERLAMEFTLPAVTGRGRPLTLPQLRELLAAEPAVFFSQELCARYFTRMDGRQPRFILFDDGDTIRRKLKQASSLGIDTAFVVYPEVEDLLGELFTE